MISYKSTAIIGTMPIENLVKNKTIIKTNKTPSCSFAAQSINVSKEGNTLEQAFGMSKHAVFIFGEALVKEAVEKNLIQTLYVVSENGYKIPKNFKKIVSIKDPKGVEFGFEIYCLKE